MTDQNERRPDQRTPDETRTQWVPADPAPAEPPAEPPAGTGEASGWFPPAPPDEPTWAPWDEPWNPTDEPFDQTAVGQPTPPDYPGASGYVSEPVTDPSQRNDSAPAGTTSWANLQALRIFAQVACPILLIVGLTFAEDGVETGWGAYTAWAIFAAVCAVIQLAPLVSRSLGLTVENAWFLAAVGTAGLVGYWVIIVLPGVSSNTGFAQTLAAGFAVIGLWLSPGRRV